jgi:hypothetical protein
MHVISRVTEEQASQIPIYIEKWRAKCLLTNPVIPALFERGLQDVHQEVGMEAPSEFIYHLSPAAMWREFEVWKPKITRVLTQFWSYQIPLCDPYSMHRYWSPGNKRPAFNFTAKRYSPGPNYALCEAEVSDETSGTVIEKQFHSELWKRFDFQVPVDWCLLNCCACGAYEPPEDYLWERLEEEDPNNRIGYEDYCFLAPQHWLLRELACVDFCHTVLGINRNERLYSGLEAVVESGSFCGTFGRLCIACERPCDIEVNQEGVKLTFRDGEVFSRRNDASD